MRHFEVWQETGQKLGDVPKQTRGWDDVANVTRGQRHKEESSDYRYFPDPDLVPVTSRPPRSSRFARRWASCPPRCASGWSRPTALRPTTATCWSIRGSELVDYFVELAGLCGDGKLASNWMQQDVLRMLKDAVDRDRASSRCGPGPLAELLDAVKDGQVDTGRAREILVEMLSTGRSAAELIAAHGIVKVDESELFALARN